MSRAAALRLALAAVAFVWLSYTIVRNLVLLTAGMMTWAFSNDMGWLLQAGRYIVEQRAIPATDLFSWTAAASDWLLYQWLFEAVVALGEGAVGLDGVVRAATLLVVVVYLLAPALGAVPRRVPLFVTLMFGATALFVAPIALQLRPMLATIAFLLIQYVLVQSYRRGGLRLGVLAGLIAVVYALWANLHMGVFLGLVSLAAFAVGDALERYGVYRFAPDDGDVEGRPAAPRAYAVLIAAAFAASLVNPYGVDIYPYLLDLSLKHEINALIPELAPPDFTESRGQTLLVLIAAGALLAYRARRFYAAGDLVQLVVFTVLTLVAERFVVLAVLLYALILPRAYYQAWVSVRSRPAISAIVGCLERVRAAYLACVAALAVAICVIFADSVQGFRHGTCEPLLPAINLYQGAKLPSDRLFNDPLMGNCIIYAQPDTKVFIDTRLDFYDPALILETFRVLRRGGDWRAALDAWGVDTILIRRTWPLAAALAASDGAQVVFADREAMIVRLRR